MKVFIKYKCRKFEEKYDATENGYPHYVIDYSVESWFFEV